MKLKLATNAERSAALKAVMAKIEALIPQLPGFFQGQVREKLESNEGRLTVLDILDAGLDAAQAVRDNNKQKKGKLT